MFVEIDAASSDLIAMNLTMAAIDRWLENLSDDRSGEQIGREIGSMYREIRAVVSALSPDEDEDDEDEDEADDEETVVELRREIAV